MYSVSEVCSVDGGGECAGWGKKKQEDKTVGEPKSLGIERQLCNRNENRVRKPKMLKLNASSTFSY